MSTLYAFQVRFGSGNDAERNHRVEGTVRASDIEDAMRTVLYDARLVGGHLTYLRELELSDREGLPWIVSSSDSVPDDHIEKQDTKYAFDSDGEAIVHALRDIADALIVDGIPQLHGIYEKVSTAVADLDAIVCVQECFETRRGFIALDGTTHATGETL